MRGDVERFFLPFLVCGNPSKQIRKRIFSQLRKMMLLGFSALLSAKKRRKFVCCREFNSAASTKTGISQCSKSHSCAARTTRMRTRGKCSVKMSHIFSLLAIREARERNENERELGSFDFDTDFFARRDDAMMVKNMWDTRRRWMGGDGGWLKWIRERNRANLHATFRRTLMSPAADVNLRLINPHRSSTMD